MTFISNIVTHVRCGCQVMRVVTPEEGRALDSIQQAAGQVATLEGSKMSVVTWDIDNGFQTLDPKDKKTKVPQDGKPKNPADALKVLAPKEGSTDIFYGDYIFVLKDFHVFLKEPLVQRTFRNLREANLLNSNRFRRPIIILTASDAIPPEIKRSVIDLEFTLPDETELQRVYTYVQGCVEGGKVACEKALQNRIILAMRGMTEPEAEEALSCAIYTNKGFSPECVTFIEDEKSKVLKSNGILTYIPKTAIANEDEIGGYDEFVRFLKVRSKAYLAKAQEVGLRLPKGVVLLGPPGTGKSTVGKVAAKILGLPLVLMDFGAVFGSLVGESESKMKATLQQVSSLGGCVLLVDDADKAFKNATSGAGDSGVTQRVFQQFLVWRSEYTGPVFVILTMNRTDGIPPELLRPGRFDAIMCSLLPDAEARKEILKIHMKKRGIKDSLSKSEWEEFAKLTEKFAGAEIEGALDEATYIAFDSRSTNVPNWAELEAAICATVPTAIRDAENVSQIENYCRDNKIRPVSSSVKLTKDPPPAKSRRYVSVEA